MIHVTPNSGFKIKHPKTFRFISEDGEDVDESMYWIQLEAEEAVCITKVSELKQQDKEPAKNNKNSEDAS